MKDPKSKDGRSRPQPEGSPQIRTRHSAATNENTEHSRSAPKIGVLMVHGIGEQAPGATLIRWGDALIQWLRGSSTRNGDNRFDDVRVERAVLPADPGSAEHPSHTELELKLNSFLNSFHKEWEADFSKVRTRWVLAEGFWADAVLAPSFPTLLRWILQILPWTLLSHFDRVAARGVAVKWRGNWLDRLLGGALGTLAALLAGLVILPFVSIFGALFLLVLLLRVIPFAFARKTSTAIQRALAATIGDSMILLTSPIQRAAIIDRVYWSYCWLVRQGCGEIAVVAHSQGAAIAHELLQDRPCDNARLLVTFGSGLRKLKEIRNEMARGSGSLWVGSLSAMATIPVLYMLLQVAGLRALVFAMAVVALGLVLTTAQLVALALIASRLERRVDKAAAKAADPVTGCLAIIFVSLFVALLIRIWYSVLVVGGIILYYGPTLYLAALLVSQRGDLPFILAIGLAVLFDVLLRVVHFRNAFHLKGIVSGDPPSGDLPSEYELPGVDARWVDIFARSDPVSNGPLVEQPPEVDTSFESCQIDNRSSPWSDHTTYWSNFEQFVPKVGQELLRLAGYDIPVVASDEDLEESSRRRTLRVRALREGRLLLCILSLGLSVAWWGTIGELAAGIRPAMAVAAAEIPVIGTGASKLLANADSGFDTLLAGGLALAAALITLGLSEALWIAWDRAASLKIVTGSSPDGHRPFAERLFFAFLFLFALAAVALLLQHLVGLWIGGVGWFP